MGSQVLKESFPMHAVHRLNGGGLECKIKNTQRILPFGLRYSRSSPKGGLQEEFPVGKESLQEFG